jgi:hypothetical protein
MSWWVYLNDENGNPVEVPSHNEGGTITLGGSTTAELNVTYNYSRFFRQVFPEGLNWLYGKTGAETIKPLERAIAELGTEQDFDYWASTPGNAGHALSILLGWAKANPGAVWEIH